VTRIRVLAWLSVLVVVPACGSDGPTPLDPATAPRASIDRFSAEAGHLMVRDGSNGLPAADQAVDFDQGPFITRGLGPQGESVQYYNFDVQPTEPALLYSLNREGGSGYESVEGQLAIVDVIPGDTGYNDFWRIVEVTVPADYVANTATSVADLASYPQQVTDTLVNCPVVPEGSTASLRLGGGDAVLHQGWYQDQIIQYFTFTEAPLAASDDQVPLSPIYVTFNINPDQDGGGPPSGFVTETDSDQTHNVVETLPGDDGYSPLWLVDVYDNADFDQVSDLASASQATILATGVADVNCPVVSIE